MRARSARRLITSSGAILLLALSIVALTDDVARPQAGEIGPAHTVTDDAPTRRSPRSIEADVPQPPAVATPLLPAGDFGAYEAAKETANATAGGSRNGAPEPAGAPPLVKPKLKGVNRRGVQSSQTDSIVPDPHGAVGSKHFVEVVNRRILVIKKAKPKVETADVSLASFFDYGAEPLVHPQVVYDHRAKRWIITAAAFPESATVQRLFLAVSAGDNPNGEFDIYNFDVDVDDNGNYLDRPMLGFNKRAIVMTGNIFDAPPPGTTTYLETNVLVLPKQDAYAGDPVSLDMLPVGATGSMAPPIVLDDRNEVFLLQSHTSGDEITVWRGAGFGLATPSVSSLHDVPVASYSVPPDAEQPGTDQLLDTGDARFLNASTQYGDRLWNVHTISQLNIATPRFYEIDLTLGVPDQAGGFWASNSSADFNASLAANKRGEVFVTWTSTDAAAGIDAEVRFSGRRPTDTANEIRRPGTVLTGSLTSFDTTAAPVEPWGASSAVSLDPVKSGDCKKQRRAWIVNQTIKSPAAWSTRIGRIGYC